MISQQIVDKNVISICQDLSIWKPETNGNLIIETLAIVSWLVKHFVFFTHPVFRLELDKGFSVDFVSFYKYSLLFGNFSGGGGGGALLSRIGWEACHCHIFLERKILSGLIFLLDRGLMARVK